MSENVHPKILYFDLGTKVVSEHGDKIGKIADVVVDQRTLDPTWLVVDPGPFRAAHFVPAPDAYRADDESVVVPFTKAVVQHSPRAPRDHFLTARSEAELREYYDVAA
jgi:sporulation protein YlmC with PRC-barrel domain